MSLEEIQYMLKQALDRLSERPDGWTLDKDNRPCLQSVSEWIQAGDFRRGLILRGPVGTGKTRVIKAAGQVLAHLHGKGICQIEAIELVNIIARAKGDRSVLEKYADPLKYKMLCIEDIDTEGNAPSFVKGDTGINCVLELVQIRYKRWEAGLPITTFFTTNATNDRLLERYGERCVSRMNHMARVIGLPGPDRRAQSVLPTPKGEQAAFVQAPVQEITSAEAKAIIDNFKSGHDVKLIERAKLMEQRKVEHLDILRARVRGMELAELHHVIQNNPYPEARDIARNQFNSVAPITYAEFCERLSDHPSTQVA